MVGRRSTPDLVADNKTNGRIAEVGKSNSTNNIPGNKYPPVRFYASPNSLNSFCYGFEFAKTHFSKFLFVLKDVSTNMVA